MIRALASRVKTGKVLLEKVLNTTFYLLKAMDLGFLGNKSSFYWIAKVEINH